MKNQRKSPFTQLVETIENFSFDFAIELQRPGKQINPDFAIGYTTALNAIYLQAMAIYKRSLSAGDVIGTDLRDRQMIAKIKRG